jgi:protein involved in polysaccharide export with SLBB domain
MRAVMLVAALVVAASAAPLAAQDRTVRFGVENRQVVAQVQDRVFVLGHIQKPGSYTLTPGMTVADLIDKAGGATSNDPIWIHRVVDGERTTVSASLSDALQAGDAVSIGQR